MTKFNPIPEDKPSGPVSPVIATRFNPLDGSFDKQEATSVEKEKNKVENETLSVNQSTEVINEDLNTQEIRISEQRARVGKSYPTPETKLNTNKIKFNPLEINGNKKFDMLDVDRSEKKKPWYKFW